MQRGIIIIYLCSVCVCEEGREGEKEREGKKGEKRGKEGVLEERNWI